ncbi:hypothetical protein NQ317_014295 [Molorchus minor]|uniref:FANCI solenoid 4 domain-containing protein n=1 Tax=Molorchus minor TaxID=1323400 RepID=A0ABQ9K0F8_9CUCU|nr:hypothetical protein NQ317_014295 [Molorchus minor]
MLVTAVNTLAILAGEIPTQCNPLSIQMCEWLKHFCYNNTVSISLTLIEQISVNIGDVIGVITEEEHTAEKFAIVNEGTVHNILLSLCDNLKSILEDVDAAIARLKSEYIGLTYPGAENVEKKLENFKTKERATCCQVCFVVTIMTNLSNLGVQPGNESEVIFKNIMLVFSTLTLLTRHFVMRSSKVNLAFQAARFERLVKLAGKQLAPAVTLKSKVLRETRLIPKVIYEIEQFSKSVILLSNRTKVDLAKYIGQGTFLRRGENNPPNTQSTQATHVSGEEMEVDDGGQENRNVDDEGLGSPPLTKRSRK